MRNPSVYASLVVHLLLLALGVLVVYSNAFHGPFLFDDEVSIEKNSSIRTLWPLTRSLWATQDTPTAGRPIPNFTFALNYACGKHEVLGYHLVNVALHILNAFLLYGLICKSLKKTSWQLVASKFSANLSFAIVLVWAVHPLQTETVDYVTQRTELLIAFFFLLTMLTSRIAWDAALSRDRLFWQAACVVSCAMGMASKEVMVAAPVMVVLYDLAIMQHSMGSLMQLRGRFYLALASTWGVLGWLLAGNPRGESVGFGLGIRLFDYITTQFWAIVRYLWLVIWPANMCGDYGTLPVSDVRMWLPCMLLIIALVALTIWAWFHHRTLSFLGLWFFIILAPSTSVIPIVTEPIAERRMYLPLAAVVVLVAIGLLRFSKRDTSQKRLPRVGSPWSVLIVLFAISGVFACVSYARNEVYDTKLLFWTDVVQKMPLNARGFQNLGNAYLEAKNVDLARTNYERAKELAPSNADSHYNLGVWHMNHGDPTVAIENFDRALSIKPKKFEAIYNRALQLSRLGRLDESIIGYRNAIRLAPKSAMAHLNLGNDLLSQERWDEAVEMYQVALQIDPKLGEAFQNIGAVFARKGEYSQAIGWLEKAVEISPDNPDTYNNLGYCYRALGRTDEAVVAYSKCVSIRPTDVEVWNILGTIYFDRGEKAKARQCFEKVLQMQPNAIEAQRALQQMTLE